MTTDDRRHANAQDAPAGYTARITGALHDRYRIERELGAGGMATVYLAEDVRHHRRVAVKVIHPELSAALGHERFLREVEISAQLQHPHILTLIDSGEVAADEAASRLLYYVMPFVDGESLRARIAREHQLPVADVSRIMREVADALSEAHARGVVHRDIKPDNVLLRANHAIVTDFGIAKAVSNATGRHELTTVGVALGTPTYMSPEQAAGAPDVDHRADIYALGVMAYEMLTGEPPFTGVTAQSVLAAHMTQVPAPVTVRRAAVPAPFAAVIMRCLEKMPADRWQSAADLLNQLDAVSTPGGGTLASEPTRSGTARWLPLARYRTLALSIVGLTILGAATYAVRSRSASRMPGDRTRPPTIVVLPFDNLGAAADDYFADGMADELRGRLSKLPGLAVIARTSAIQYKKTTKPITQIAKELGADFLIEGTVRWEKTADGGGRVRVSPEMVRASDGTHVWNDTFDKPYGADVFSIQSAIAEQVARSLDVSMRPGDARIVRQVPTTNLAAYDAYNRALSALDRDFGQNWDAQRVAFEQLEQAVRLDSSFADAHAMLASLHLGTIVSGYDISLGTGILPEQRLESARALATRAIALDSTSGLGHAMLGGYYYLSARDTARQREQLEIALRSEPSSPDAIAARGWGLAMTGRLDDGLREITRALSMDPRNPRRWLDLANFQRRRGDWAASSVALERGLDVAPNQAELYLELVWNQVRAGRRDDARTTVRNGITQVGANTMVFQISQGTASQNLIRMFQELMEPARRITMSQFGRDSADYYIAKTRGYHTDPTRVKAYYDSLLAWARPRAAASTRDPVYRVTFVWALAGSGRRAEATQQLVPVLREDIRDASYIVVLAEACVMIGDNDCAVAQLARALALSTAYSRAFFQLDPVWDPLRERADFKRLMEAR